MTRRSRSARFSLVWRRFLVPIAATAVALMVTIALRPLVQRNTLVVFLVSISLSAWAGGLQAGLWSTLLTVVAAGFLLFHPDLSMQEETTADLVVLGLVTIAGVFVSALTQKLHTAAARAREAHVEAEMLRAKSELARREADKANLAKARFLTTMSHELRTPLNAITGYAELLALGVHGPLTPEQERAIGAIERSGRHLLSQINNILDFAKLEAGEVFYDVNDVRIGDALRDIEVMVQPQLEAKGLDYKACSIPPEWTVRADQQKVQQILLNLLSNAVKFTPDRGEVVLECEARQDAVTISIADSGRGIPPDKHEAIFQPFVQLEGNEARALGTGLGLPISRELARGMHGDLSVESEVGAGSRFLLTLPRGTDATPAHVS
jgi:signal transduction histidine kinase